MTEQFTPRVYEKVLQRVIERLCEDSSDQDACIKGLLKFWQSLDGGVLFSLYFGVGEHGEEIFRQAIIQAACMERDNELCEWFAAKNIPTQAQTLADCYRYAYQHHVNCAESA